MGGSGGQHSEFTALCIAMATKWLILGMILVHVCICALGIAWMLSLHVCPCRQEYACPGLYCMFLQACIHTHTHTRTEHIPAWCLTLVRSLSVWRESVSGYLLLLLQTKACFCHPSIRKETKVTHKAAVSPMASCVNVLPEWQAPSCADLGINGEGGTGMSGRIRQRKHAVAALHRCQTSYLLGYRLHLPS